MYTQYIYLGAVPSESLNNAFLGQIRNFVYNRMDVIEVFYQRVRNVEMQAAGSPPIRVVISTEKIMTAGGGTLAPDIRLPFPGLVYYFTLLGNALTVFHLPLASLAARPPAFRLRVRFQTFDQNALLLLINHTSEYLALEFENGALVMRASLSGFGTSQPARPATFTFDFQGVKLNNYLPHALDIAVGDGNFTVTLWKVSSETAFDPPIVFRQQFNTNADGLLPFTNGDFYFGGLRSDEHFQAFSSLFGLRSKRNLIGCFYHLEINNQILERSLILRYSPLFTFIETCSGCTLSTNVYITVMYSYATPYTYVLYYTSDCM